MTPPSCCTYCGHHRTAHVAPSQGCLVCPDCPGYETDNQEPRP